MDIGAYFSPLEFNEVLDIHFVGYYGFTTRAVFGKLKELENEEAALDYLISYRDKLITINKELYFYHKNPDYKINKVKNRIAKAILEDVKSDKYGFSLFEFLDQLNPFFLWIENLVRKFSFLSDFAEMSEPIEIKQESIPKIVWLGKKEDFAALFDKLIDARFFPYKKDKYQLLAKHFTWIDGEIDPNTLKHLTDNVKNHPETHQTSEELKNLKFEY